MLWLILGKQDSIEPVMSWSTGQVMSEAVIKFIVYKKIQSASSRQTRESWKAAWVKDYQTERRVGWERAKMSKRVPLFDSD